MSLQLFLTYIVLLSMGISSALMLATPYAWKRSGGSVTLDQLKYLYLMWLVIFSGYFVLYALDQPPYIAGVALLFTLGGAIGIWFTRQNVNSAWAIAGQTTMIATITLLQPYFSQLWSFLPTAGLAALAAAAFVAASEEQDPQTRKLFQAGGVVCALLAVFNIITQLN